MNREVSVKEAFRAAKGNISKWSDTENRLHPETWPVLQPSFELEPGTTVLTIGSCFARNIEEYLLYSGLRIPAMDLRVPLHEWHYRPNGILNKYSPADIFQEIKLTFEMLNTFGDFSEEYYEKYIYGAGENRWDDLSLAGARTVTKERLFERRRDIFNIFRRAFDCEYIVITLGLIEIWNCYPAGQNCEPIALSNLPLSSGMNKDKFKFKILNFAESYKYIHDTISLIRSHNAGSKFLITTSPVPMNRTFSGEDVIIANTSSKSQLRTVCAEIANTFGNVDYFPSYESVMLSEKSRVWCNDRQHVTDRFVGKIVLSLLDNYLPGLDEGRRRYIESTINWGRGNLEEAKSLAKSLLVDHPSSDDYSVLMASILQSEGQPQEALKFLRENSSIRSMVLRAKCYWALKRYQEAFEVSKSAFAKSPEFITAKQYFTDLKFAEGEKAVEKEAERIFVYKPYPDYVNNLLSGKGDGDH